MNLAVPKPPCTRTIKIKINWLSLCLLRVMNGLNKAFLGYVGDATGLEAINKILDWHTNWFRQDFLKAVYL